jgi:hypothetical protein
MIDDTCRNCNNWSIYHPISIKYPNYGTCQNTGEDTYANDFCKNWGPMNIPMDCKTRKKQSYIQQDKKMKKICIESLSIETTRRCNLKCRHCLRGGIQNINLKKEYLANTLKQIE